MGSIYNSDDFILTDIELRGRGPDAGIVAVDTGLLELSGTHEVIVDVGLPGHFTS